MTALFRLDLRLDSESHVKCEIANAKTLGMGSMCTFLAKIKNAVRLS